MNKVALVTGASRGIGRGIALQLGQEGWDICVNYIHQKEAAEGVVTFTYDPSNYHVTIVECPDGYTADPEQAFYFEGEATELTVEITKN